MPVASIARGFVAEAGIFGEPGFRERDEVLVAVQLPDDFVVADLVEIEEGNLVPRDCVGRACRGRDRSASRWGSRNRGPGNRAGRSDVGRSFRPASSRPGGQAAGGSRKAGAAEDGPADRRAALAHRLEKACWARVRISSGLMRARRVRFMDRGGENASLVGDEDIAPELQIQQAPDAIGGVFEAASCGGRADRRGR